MELLQRSRTRRFRDPVEPAWWSGSISRGNLQSSLSVSLLVGQTSGNETLAQEHIILKKNNMQELKLKVRFWWDVVLKGFLGGFWCHELPAW